MKIKKEKKISNSNSYVGVIPKSCTYAWDSAYIWKWSVIEWRTDNYNVDVSSLVIIHKHQN